jgi:peroxiredoxin
MKKIALILAVLTLLVIIVPACPGTGGQTSTTTSTGTEGSRVGNLAPNFQLQDVNFDAVSLRDYRGSPIMLNFWATWCGPCRHEMPFIQQVYEGWQERGLIIITVNLGEDQFKVSDFMRNNGLTFPALLDIQKSVAGQYDVTAIPTTFFIDKDGVIQERRVGSYSSVEDIENSLIKIMP